MKTIEMAINKSRTINATLTMILALLVSACGLKDDLYIPEDETEAEAVPVEVQDTEDPNAGVDTQEEPGQLSEQTP